MHESLTLSVSRTVAAVSVPPESFWPVATKHLPVVMSAKVSVLVRSNVVELV